MTSNTLGEQFRITTFGESHGSALGVVIDGVKPNIPIDAQTIQMELNRRRPGQSAATTGRDERDALEILSGIFEGKTTGAPIAIIIRNTNQRSDDYDTLKDLFRPGHADFTWLKKFGIRDWRGGGRSSGRETVARVAAGAIAKQLLKSVGVDIYAHVVALGDIKAKDFSRDAIERNSVRCADPTAAAAMEQAIAAVKAEDDSLGGVVEVVALGVPAGLGDPVFHKLEAMLGAAFLSIGSVKAVESGDGFAAAEAKGSQNNDAMTPEGFATNHAGGVLGGISTGAPLIFRLGVKPTASISKPQSTVDTSGHAQNLMVKGRHDPCICPRLTPVAEAMMAIVLCDALLRQQAITEAPLSTDALRHEMAFLDSELVRIIALRQRIATEAAAHGVPNTLADGEVRTKLAQDAGLDASRTAPLFAALDQLCSV